MANLWNNYQNIKVNDNIPIRSDFIKEFSLEQPRYNPFYSSFWTWISVDLQYSTIAYVGTESGFGAIEAFINKKLIKNEDINVTAVRTDKFKVKDGAYVFSPPSIDYLRQLKAEKSPSITFATELDLIEHDLVIINNDTLMDTLNFIIASSSGIKNQLLVNVIDQTRLGLTEWLLLQLFETVKKYGNIYYCTVKKEFNNELLVDKYFSSDNLEANIKSDFLNEDKLFSTKISAFDRSYYPKRELYMSPNNDPRIQYRLNLLSICTIPNCKNVPPDLQCYEKGKVFTIEYIIRRLDFRGKITSATRNVSWMKNQELINKDTGVVYYPGMEPYGKYDLMILTKLDSNLLSYLNVGGLAYVHFNAFDEYETDILNDFDKIGFIRLSSSNTTDLEHYLVLENKLNSSNVKMPDELLNIANSRLQILNDVNMGIERAISYYYNYQQEEIDKMVENAVIYWNSNFL